MRSFYWIAIFVVSVGLITGGCQLKQSEYGKFTKDEIEEMGYAQVDGLPPVSGGVTLSIMGETVTANEIVNNEPMIESLRPMNEYDDYKLFAKKARQAVSRVVMGKVSDILLYQLARKDSPGNVDEMLEKAVETEIDKHVANYKNNFAKAEQAFKEMGFIDWDNFREYKKKLVMTQFYISKQIKKNQPIMHSEMINRYNTLKKEFFEVEGILVMRVIEINPDKLAADEIDSVSGETPSQAAIRKGKELVALIKGGEDFAKLAGANSHGSARKKGGLWDNIILGSMMEPYDELEKAAEKMEPGDVSDVIKAGKYVFIMKLEDKREASVTPFIDVQDRIEAEIGLIRQRIEYNKVLVEVVNQADIKDLDIFTNYCLRQAFNIITEK